MEGVLFRPGSIGALRLGNAFLIFSAAAWRATEQGDIALNTLVLQAVVSR